MKKHQMSLEEFASRISDIVWGGELGWVGEGQLEKLAEAVRKEFSESRTTIERITISGDNQTEQTYIPPAFIVDIR